MNNKKPQSVSDSSIYDPNVVDDRLDFLNAKFNDELWQVDESNKRKEKYKGRDPKIKSLEEFRKQRNENG